MQYTKNPLMSITEQVIRSVLNIPSDFKVKQKWSSSRHFHFLVLAPLIPATPFVKGNKEMHVLPYSHPSLDMDKDERWRWREISEWVDEMARGEMINQMDDWMDKRKDGWVEAWKSGKCR